MYASHFVPFVCAELTRLLCCISTLDELKDAKHHVKCRERAAIPSISQISTGILSAFEPPVMDAWNAWRAAENERLLGNAMGFGLYSRNLLLPASTIYQHLVDSVPQQDGEDIVLQCARLLLAGGEAGETVYEQVRVGSANFTRRDPLVTFHTLGFLLGRYHACNYMDLVLVSYTWDLQPPDINRDVRTARRRLDDARLQLRASPLYPWFSDVLTSVDIPNVTKVISIALGEFSSRSPYGQERRRRSRTRHMLLCEIENVIRLKQGDSPIVRSHDQGYFDVEIEALRVYGIQGTNHPVLLGSWSLTNPPSSFRSTRISRLKKSLLMSLSQRPS
ncbi:uncharacterized protein B0T15DRAFT_511980 [Chaetomium strumarium]|uniref:Uncharacterized protein n=1 Tax=Chaetomium strumarium TaxID=1170767 RepID=A0AAJ0GUK8_9PEZI|nr:hypothetical protein B0T15DRAFT_511980 [Chaetomium strumarium]